MFDGETMEKFGECADERAVIYRGDDNNIGKYCSFPFLMNEM